MDACVTPIRFVRRPVPGRDYGESYRQFNELQGRLRVSVTHACQLHCRFCHQEGIDAHWQKIAIDPGFFSRLVRSYADSGGRLVELTGGEPTAHPKIGALIDVVSDTEAQTILCTNGLKLDRVMPQITAGRIDLIRLSLHATDSGTQAKSLLGQSWSFERLRANVEKALQQRTKFQLIFTHSGQNTQYLASVLELALQWNVDLQVVDLITSRAHRPAEELGYVAGAEGQRIIEARGVRLEREVRDRTGAVLKLYRTPSGQSWEVKDYHFGLLHSSMCGGCKLRQDCGEGIYALRVDSLGVVKPCLLREDLQDTLSTQSSEEAIRSTLGRNLEMMLSGPLQWN